MRISPLCLLALFSLLLMAVARPDCHNSTGRDDDQDGVANRDDNCPDISNSDQLNSDADSFGDACDNCPFLANADQADSDADDAGDLCDACPDEAGTDPREEGCPFSGVISLMAANITSGNNAAYEAEGIRLFQGLDPDIVMIQEFNYRGSPLRQFVDTAFGPLFTYAIESDGERIPNGVISRYPILASGEWKDEVNTDRDFFWAVIDIPGPIDMQLVSVHLSGSSAAGRNSEALALQGYVASELDPNQYIAIGGDLNVTNRTEATMNTFRTFMEIDTHIPVDPYGNSNTNEPRSKPYDWVMPSALLDAAQTDLIIGSESFSEGLVFDSAAYTDTLPAPIQANDSHVDGMQHMPVMKAFWVGQD
jgi:hypothetical protein